MPRRTPALSAAIALLLAAASAIPPAAGMEAAPQVRAITWEDLGPLASRLVDHGLTRDRFPSHLDTLRQHLAGRVREGDLDHLVFYLLQSRRFSTAAPIEPALSARAFVEGLPSAERQAFLDGRDLPGAALPGPVRARIRAFLDAPTIEADPRFDYFRGLVAASFPDAARERELQREYRRVARFLYQKEFVARAAPDPAAAVAELYRARGLSTDTAVEAGFLVQQGLGVVKGLDPSQRIRRVLIVGPGLDLAPRTAYTDERPLESYQPWAVVDALVSLRLARLDDLEVVAADINPRVVEHLARARQQPPRLSLVSEIRESATLKVTAEFREYFASLGQAIGKTEGKEALHKVVEVSPEAAAVLHPVRLDVVTERLASPIAKGSAYPGAGFDLIVATNVLPYFDDPSLLLALSNLESMLAPGGVLLHNEPRPFLVEAAAALGLPLVHSRHAVIATVRGAPAPLADSVFLHRRRP